MSKQTNDLKRVDDTKETEGLSVTKIPPPENQVYYHSAECMKELPDNSVNLVVTSPPYFNIKDYNRDGVQSNEHSDVHPQDCGHINNYDHYLEALLKIWHECARVLSPNGKLAINAPLMPMKKSVMSTHYNRDIFNIYSDIEQMIVKDVPDMYLMDMYIWNRANGQKKLMFGSYPYPRNFYAQNTVEFIGIFVKDGKPVTVDQARKKQSALSEEEWREYTKQVWDIPIPNKGDLAHGEHPAIMPEEIARRCIRLFTYVDDIVLDPFAGSGTTLKVAKELQRKYIGYEIYEHYRDLINQKLQGDSQWLPSTTLLNAQLQLKFPQ